MTHIGYMIIKQKKCLNLYLFSKDIHELEEALEEDMSPAARKDCRIVPCLKDNNGSTFLDIDNKLVRIS